MTLRIKILSTGSFTPTKRVSNDDLSKVMDTSDEWIVKRTGIHFRHIAGPNELTSDLALSSSLQALERANISKDEIDLIIVATICPDKTFPSTATILQQKLGIKNCAAFDISAACSGFIYALSVAENMLKCQQFKKALVVGAETFSRLLNYDDRSTAVLFGDGAGACILGPSEDDSGIYFSKIQSDGNYGDILTTTGGVSSTQTSGFIEMNGKEVFKLGTEKMSKMIKEAQKHLPKSANWIIPHQANIRMIQLIAQNLSLPIDKFLLTIEDHANTSAASIPLCLDHFVSLGKVKKNDGIIFASVGAGLTWGGMSIIY